MTLNLALLSKKRVKVKMNFTWAIDFFLKTKLLDGLFSALVGCLIMG